jgi:ribosomal protein S27E
MEAFELRKTRTKKVPRSHFERHYFRCGDCGSEKVIWLDVTSRRKVLGI